ncbi:MAG: hypothetical protein LAO03_18650 [Acidobacteriia bacterium]|nr:hypothetical protein [Terriglobia bacterium]
MKPDPSDSNAPSIATPSGVRAGLRKVERREWWLWSSAVLVTLLLTLGVVSFVFPMVRLGGEDSHFPDLSYAARGLVGMVLLFDLYSVYQQLQIHRMRRRLIEGEELFRLITENAADMIAVCWSRMPPKKPSQPVWGGELNTGCATRMVVGAPWSLRQAQF